MQTQRRKMPRKEIAKASSKICQLIQMHPTYQSSQTILFYAAINNEVNLNNLAAIALQAKKKVCFPKIEQEHLQAYQITSLNQLTRGTYGILEPNTLHATLTDKKNIDLILIPALAYDKQGNRIGYGKGYYDHFLMHTNAHKMGIAFDFQIIPSIPAESHDQKVNSIVTQRSTLTC
jgi:5-formyltetrahydrofolate cyclo-ligase